MTDAASGSPTGGGGAGGAGAHDARVREQFRRQAATFTDTGFAANGLAWIVGELAPAAGDRVLDVAAGAAHLGRALAPHVGHVSALDLTPEMLAQGDRLARDAGLANVDFLVGDAAALPWLDAQFDLVVCRLTLHQVADPAAVVREMVRVTRPGGRLGITDLVLADGLDADAAERNTRLERLRDPSHHRTLSPSEIRRLLADAGAVVTATSSRPVELDLEDWMARTATPGPAADEIRRRLDAERDGGPPTGLGPGVRDGARTLTHTWATVRAVPAVP